MRQHSKLSRFLSLALCICMVLAMIPAIPLVANAATISKGTTLYLKPGTNWASANARFAAYFYNSTSDNTWVSMSDADGNGIYECQAPTKSWNNVIFCRMNPSNSTNSWDTKWNQTKDLTYDGTKNLYTVPDSAWDNGSGSWSAASCKNFQVPHKFTDNKCSVCDTEGVTIYFQNNWEWEDVRVHYMGSVKSGWPGFEAPYYGKAMVDGQERLYNKIVVPKDVDIIINGWDEQRTSNKDETATIKYADCKDGMTFYIDSGKVTDGKMVCTVKTYPICNDFSAEHKYDANNTCTRCSKTKCQNNNGHTFSNNECTICGIEGKTVYFQNNWIWNDVRVHYWKDGDVSTEFPGVTLNSLGYADGFGDSANHWEHFSVTVPKDCDGFKFSGINPNTNEREESQNLKLFENEDDSYNWHARIGYWMQYSSDDNSKVAVPFDICLAVTHLHDWQTLDAEEATCTQEGKAEGQKCAYCETVKQETAPVKPHNQDGDICADCGAELMDIYFENSWKWKNVKIYYWFADKRPVPAYPGVAMESYGTNNGNEYFGFKIPKNVAGFVFSGTGTGNSEGQKEETVDIESGWYNGATYYPDKRVNGKETDKCTVGNFPICVDFPRNHKFVDNKCAFCGNPEYIWIFLKDVWNWSNVEIHYRGSRIANNDLAEVSIPMTLWEEGSNIYYAVIPADPDFICFTGSDFTSGDDFASDLIESGWTHGTLYELDSKGGNKRDTITSVYPCALGHDFKAVVTDPTCISEGFTTYTCARTGCGTIERGDSVAKNPDNHAGELIYVDNGNGTHHQKWNCCHTPTGAPEDHINNDKDGRCDICNALMAPVQLMNIAAGLDGKISVNYFFLLSEEVVANETAYVQFKVGNNEPVIVPVSEAKYVESTGYYQFTYEVAAKEMTDFIYTQFYVGEDATWTKDHEYNVRKYAGNILNQHDDKNTIELMKAMVTYGAAAQAHFGYATDDLANSILAEEEKIDLSKVFIENYSVQRGQGTSKVKFYSASLILESETTLRLFFSGRPASVTHNGNELTINQRAGLYYVDIPGISAKDLDEDVTVVLSDGEITTNIVYNPMSYCQSILKAADGMYPETMKDLVRALYLYNKAANAYFGE